jgi:hypothetical protein
MPALQPALSKARERARLVQCLNDMKQLTLGWTIVERWQWTELNQELPIFSSAASSMDDLKRLLNGAAWQ